MKDVLKKKAQILFNRVNMVRAGVVSHPSEWTSSGYNEIQKPRNRYGLIDHQSLMNLLNIDNHEDLKELHRKWVERSLKGSNRIRESKWTQSIAVGNKQFIEKIKEQLGVRARGRKAKESKDGYQLRESQTSYGGDGNRIDKNNIINNVDIDNTSLWNIYS